MSIENQAKNVEGKIQAAAGEVTGNSEDKLAGNAKQAQSQAAQGAEDVMDNIKDKAEEIKDKVGNAFENLKEKVTQIGRASCRERVLMPV